ncbi:hypothetical protein, partial [Salmonella sp. s55044]|uniref:hypothetical protein n=1 Tax=Salmonella sp. s55044 TaxID=3159677 RepID=UPI00397FB9F2
AMVPWASSVMLTGVTISRSDHHIPPIVLVLVDWIVVIITLFPFHGKVYTDSNAHEDEYDKQETESFFERATFALSGGVLLLREWMHLDVDIVDSLIPFLQLLLINRVNTRLHHGYG